MTSLKEILHNDHSSLIQKYNIFKIARAKEKYQKEIKTYTDIKNSTFRFNDN